MISGCEGLFTPTTPTLQELLSAPEQVEIYGRKFTLETFLWRDFMPVSPPNGKPLIALIWVTAADLSPFPPSVDANRLWVINVQDVWDPIWETKFSDEERPKDPNHQHQLEKIGREGPKWGPGVYVDVVVRIVDYKGVKYLLRASKQYIGRTD